MLWKKPEVCPGRRAFGDGMLSYKKSIGISKLGRRTGRETQKQLLTGGVEGRTVVMLHGTKKNVMKI